MATATSAPEGGENNNIGSNHAATTESSEQRAAHDPASPNPNMNSAASTAHEAGRSQDDSSTVTAGIETELSNGLQEAQDVPITPPTGTADAVTPVQDDQVRLPTTPRLPIEGARAEYSFCDPRRRAYSKHHRGGQWHACRPLLASPRMFSVCSHTYIIAGIRLVCNHLCRPHRAWRRYGA